MTKYNAIENEVRESYKEKGKNIRFYIHHGYMASWAADEYKKESDGGIKEYSTDYRWKQYQSGKISREKAVEYAVIRALKKLEKELLTDLKRLEAIENAKIPSFISIRTEWVRNSTWGRNPHTEIYVQSEGYFEGRASGCGYDKESAAFASAAKGSFSLEKILCELKESALEEGKSDKSETSCTGINNREVCGYGAGYEPIPCFEGGVGMNSIISIFRKYGYNVVESHGKMYDSYELELKKEEE